MKIKANLDPLRERIGGVELRPAHVIQQLEQVVHWMQCGFDQMERPEDTGNPIESLTAIGTLVLLGVVEESLVVLAQKDARYELIYDEHAESLAAWVQMRHDMAHLMDRLFRVRGGRDPITRTGSESAVTIGVSSRDKQGRLVITTGDKTPLVVAHVRDELDAIVFACRIVDEGETPVLASAKSLYEMATGKAAPDGPVTPEILALLYREIRNLAAEQAEAP